MKSRLLYENIQKYVLHYICILSSGLQMSYCILSSGQKRTGSGKTVDNQQGGYATNFGSSLGGAGSRGIEGQLVASVFKALVSRFVKSSKELKNPENMVNTFI